MQAILQGSCLEVAPQIYGGLKFPWDLLTQKGLLLSRIDLADGTRVDIPYYAEPSSQGANRFNTRFYVSPDGKWLTYQDAAQKNVFVESTQTLTTAAGQQPIVWSLGKKVILQRWLNEDTLLILYRKAEGDRLITSLLLNPFSETMSEVSPGQFPDILQAKGGGAVMTTHYWVNGDVALDPTKQRVLYPVDEGEYKYSVLWDMKEKKTLARLRLYLELYNDPFWSLDGRTFAIISYSPDNFAEWFQVSREGKIHQVTDFADVLKQTDYLIVLPSLSWDGRYLAFELVDPKERWSPKYIVLDLQSKDAPGFCVDGVPGSSQPAPVWSPDSRYLVISNTESSIGSLILVDVARKLAYQIGKDVDAIGWIEK